MEIKKSAIIINVIIPALAGVMIFMYLFYGRHGALPSLYDYLDLYLLSVVITTLIGISSLAIEKYSMRFWDAGIRISVLTTVQLTAKIITAFIILFGISTLFFILVEKNSLNDLWIIYYDEIIKLVILSGGAMLFYSLVSFALQSYNYYSYYSIERVRQERNQLSLQYEALKGQLSPHYLFNCLNTISSLVHKNGHQAEDFIRRMAKTFQYVLNNDNKRLVSIQEELEFLKSYNYLLKVRFEDHLQLNIDTPKSIKEGFIPPLTLQMLLENAVKHNVIDHDHPLKFMIYFEGDDKLVVENNKTTTPAHKESFNIGLENIIKRYQHLCSSPVVITDTDKFIVKLPVIRKNNPEDE